MVLESLFSASELEKKPIDMLVLSIIVTTLCTLISYIIFPEYSGIITPLLVTATMSPVFFLIFKMEENVERKVAEHKLIRGFWDRHDETIKIFTYFFIGNFIAIFVFAVFLPETFLATAFNQQIESITRITSMSGYVLNPTTLNLIIMNNLKVMFFAFLLSFLIGAGALFILSWNASILAIYLASFVREGLYHDFLLRSVSIAPHAPIEILSYFLAGIAGGILSVGVIREKLKSKEFLFVFKDSLLLMILAVAAVVFGGFLEVFV